MAKKHPLPQSILFVCEMNMVRSPMAAGLMRKLFPSVQTIESCGLMQGEADQWVETVMSDIGVDMSEHQPKTLHDLENDEFDIVIAFTPSATEGSKAFFEGQPTEILQWPLPMPGTGSLDVRAVLNDYRAMRDVIKTRLLNYFEAQ